MKILQRWTLWDIKRDLKHSEQKVKFLKLVLKHLEKEYRK